ncbi:MAG: pyrimidine 5'-nucleotidase [Sphingomonadaceae bacterium]|nr:pyrimidine 5'-nucleotidase [Sphingomonadaceae bacterium]
MPNAAPGAAAIDCWIFDLDNSLYPPSSGLFRQIDARMGQYIMQLLHVDALAARQVQKQYFHEHGTTLAGLMAHHQIDPTYFLDFVHDIDLSVLHPDAGLRAAINALPGKRHIFTNADHRYARRVLGALNLDDLFDSIVDIEATALVPKPQQAAYHHMASRIGGFDPARALFVDDMSRNLAPAHAMGIATLWIDNGSEAGARGHDPTHVSHHIRSEDASHIDALADWLMRATGTVGQTGDRAKEMPHGA